MRRLDARQGAGAAGALHLAHIDALWVQRSFGKDISRQKSEKMSGNPDGCRTFLQSFMTEIAKPKPYASLSVRPLGYIQLETASGQMNNKQSNAFSENTFTFEDPKQAELMEEVKNYILYQVERTKSGSRF